MLETTFHLAIESRDVSMADNLLFSPSQKSFVIFAKREESDIILASAIESCLAKAKAEIGFSVALKDGLQQ